MQSNTVDPANIRYNMNDDEIEFTNKADETKKCKLDCSDITTATTKTLKVPNHDGTIISTSDIPATDEVITWSGTEPIWKAPSSGPTSYFRSTTRSTIPSFAITLPDFQTEGTHPCTLNGPNVTMPNLRGVWLFQMHMTLDPGTAYAIYFTMIVNGVVSPNGHPFDYRETVSAAQRNGGGYSVSF